ncbi:MAG TPA: BON domain-containing protein [Vicinamibacterales bacterium]
MRRDRTVMLAGIGVGMGLMYLVDPDRGRRRRALVKDKLSYSAHTAVHAMGTAGRDVAHRANGVVARVRRAFQPEDVDDDLLIERVRAQLGRAVSHPHAIHVEAVEGCVTLSGPILDDEVTPLMRAVARVRGVCGIVNALDQHEAGEVPALQSNGERRSSARQWAPATRLVLGTAGTALAGYGASRRDIRGAVLAATGVGLLARAGRRM